MSKQAATAAQVDVEPVPGTSLRHAGGWSIMMQGERVTLRLPSHVSMQVAAASTEALVTALHSGRCPLVVVLDMLDVEEFDASAPVVAIHIASRVRFVVDHVELLVADQAVRAAAISALRVLDVPFSVAEARDEI
jgi:hypothetical protein